ncbi:hypothetical protein D3C72_1122200 [compost metagenome]
MVACLAGSLALMASSMRCFHRGMAFPSLVMGSGSVAASVKRSRPPPAPGSTIRSTECTFTKRTASRSCSAPTLRFLVRALASMDRPSSPCMPRLTASTILMTVESVGSMGLNVPTSEPVSGVLPSTNRTL